MEAIVAIPKRGLSNLTGLLKLKLIGADDVLAVMEPHRYADAASLIVGHALPPSGLVLAVGAVVVEMHLTPGAGFFSEKLQDGAQGEWYTQAVGLTLPRHHAETTEALRRLVGRKLMAIVLDANNVARLVGMPRQPLRVGVVDAATSAASTTLTLATETRMPAYFLPGYSDSALFGTGADFSARSFSYTFKRY